MRRFQQATADIEWKIRQMERSALQVQVDVIGALCLRETHVRFGRTRLGIVWAFLEPIAHAVILTLMYFVLNRQAPVGGSMPLFFLTGLLPYFLWDKICRRLATSFTSDRTLLKLPLITNLDVLIGRALLEGAVWILVAFVLIRLLVATGYGELPFDIRSLCSAVCVTFILGFGIGSINATMSTLFRSWPQIFSIATRPLYLSSGVFYLVDQLPEMARRVLVWNPIVHAIEWFRSSFYPAYGSVTLDRLYLVQWAVCSLVLGLAIERLARRRISAQ